MGGDHGEIHSGSLKWLLRDQLLPKMSASWSAVRLTEAAKRKRCVL